MFSDDIYETIMDMNEIWFVYGPSKAWFVDDGSVMYN